MKKLVLSFISILMFLSANDNVMNYECKFPTYSSKDGLHKSKSFNLNFKLDIIS